MNMPNKHQLGKRKQLQNELLLKRDSRATLPSGGTSPCGYDFTEVDEVTVVITKWSRNARGGYKVPAVRHYDETFYPTNLDAAANAKDLFTNQRARDNKDLEKAKEFARGHFGAKVNTDWYCNDKDCPCQNELDIKKRRQRSLLN
jgi:hypothetical protein